MRESRPIVQCPVCKKYFKARSNHGKLQIVCSKECFSVYMSKTKSLKQLAEELGTDIKGAMQIIDKEHNVDNMTIKAIAEKYGLVRISLMRWCKKYGITQATWQPHGVWEELGVSILYKTQIHLSVFAQSPSEHLTLSPPLTSLIFTAEGQGSSESFRSFQRSRSQV